MMWFIFILYFIYMYSRAGPKQLKTKHTGEHKKATIRRKYCGVDKEYDAIVIGGGPSSLCTAALLARLNWKVLVVEQNEVLGGGLHTFTKKGYEFNTGLHYVGVDSNCTKFLDFLLDKKIEWDVFGSDITGNVYDSIKIGDRELRLQQGRKGWMKSMMNTFPSKKKELDAYYNAMAQVEHWHISLYFRLKALRLPQRVIKWLQRNICSTYHDMVNISVYDKLISLSIDPNSYFGRCLCGQYGDYGLLPKDAPFFIHAAIVMHYVPGGCLPKNGTQEIIKGLTSIIVKAGGHAVCKANCTKILKFSNNRIGGILINDTDVVMSQVVISGIGKYSTDQLLSFEKIPTPPLRASCSYMYLFIGLKHCDMQLRQHNCWYYPKGNFNDISEAQKCDPDGLVAPLSYFIGKVHIQDAHKRSVIMLCPAFEAWYSDWKNMSHDELTTCTEYIEWKRKFTLRMLEEFYKLYPGIEYHVDLAELGTPLSTKHYLGSSQGEVYGLASTKERWLEPLHPIATQHGLYYTGQDIVTPGLAGAVSSAELTANCVTGYANLLDVLSNRDLVADLTYKTSC
jgi:all-trans-retinol 13,14-reductase